MIKATVNEEVLEMSDETLLKDAMRKVKKIAKFKNSDLKDIDDLVYNYNKSLTLKTAIEGSTSNYNAGAYVKPVLIFTPLNHVIKFEIK